MSTTMTQARSIGFRFSSVFFLVFILVVVLGLFSLWRLKDYHVIASDIRERYLRNTQFLGDLNNFTSDFRAAEGTALLTSTPAESLANQQEVEVLDRRITLAQHSYEHVRNDATESELYADFAAKWYAYRNIAGSVLAASSVGHRPDAITLYMTTSRTAYNAASDALETLTERNRLSADEASSRSEAAYRQARWLTTFAVAIAALIVVSGLVHIRHAILVPVLDLARRMHRLAANEMDIEIDGVGRTDEIGEMARAMVVFRNNAVDLAVSQRGLAQQASMLGEKLAHEQQLAELQRNFVSMASHEFRTPLTVIDGHAQRLINARDRLTPDIVTERAGKVRTAVMRMTSVIDNLISSSQLIDGDPELYFHPSTFDMAALLHEVCHLHREVAPRARIVERLETRHIPILGDQKLLFQVFSNIVSNAVKYSPGDGVILVEACITGDEAEVTVKDNGLGIPRADIERLFERYYRGSNVSGIVGTGIGLYLVRTVIDLHRGTISVESKQGEGTRFSVRLPVVSPLPAQLHAPSHAIEV